MPTPWRATPRSAVIAIDFKLRKEKKQEIDHEIRERRQELYAQEKLDRSDWNELSQEEREAHEMTFYTVSTPMPKTSLHGKKQQNENRSAVP
ncbi:hypothetical protein GGD50_003020 [Rhizobium paranaense]|uniref:Uncharacterized protein n=1 Tax=Rhizobium paranaense TaxID=1650438 RepID=A0A7W8XRR7_9HYPH|nr:hypothetical protein [Rhizobium paranaense]